MNVSNVKQGPNREALSKDQTLYNSKLANRSFKKFAGSLQ